MPNDLSYYLKYINFQGSSKNDIQEMSDKYSEQRNNAISPFSIQINSNEAKDIKLNGISHKALISYKRIKDAVEDALVRKIQMNSGIMKYGDYIEYIDKNGQTNMYLIKSKIEPKFDYDETIMKICNNSLNQKVKINNKDEILEIPCITNSNGFSMEEGRYFNTDDKKITCEVGYSMKDKLKYISDTENQTRFIINGRAFKTYAIDDINKMIGKQGIYLVKLESCTKLPEDDLVNNIAYNGSKDNNTNPSKPNDPNNPPIPLNYKIVSSTGDVDCVTVGGFVRTFKIVNDNGSDIIDKTFTFTIEQSEINPELTPQQLIQNIEVKNGTSVKLTSNKSNITGKFVLKGVCNEDKTIIVERTLRVKKNSEA